MSAAKRWRVRPAKSPLRGVVKVPGDKSISHRAVILSSLATGESTLRGLGTGDDVTATLDAVRSLGVEVTLDQALTKVKGHGLDGLRAPSGVIDCRNSGTAMRLLAGVLVAQSFDSRIVGDASLSRRPMARVTRPLRARGASIEGVIDGVRRDETAPLEITGLTRGRRLFELEHTLDVASAQVKSALLFSGLFADGPTLLREPVVSRDHTERMLSVMGAPIETMGPLCRLDPVGWSGALSPLEIDIPGDASSAAFIVAAAHVVPGSRVIVRGVCTNPTRMGFAEVLRDQGGGVWVDPKGEQGGEPVGDLHVGARRSAELMRGAKVAGELTVRCLDEVPVLVALAGVSRGESYFEDLEELKVKESDRVTVMAEVLGRFGVEHGVSENRMWVRGTRPRGGVTVDSRGDHRVAMSAAVMALGADGETVIEGVGCVETSFRGFAETLRGLGADIEELG